MRMRVRNNSGGSLDIERSASLMCKKLQTLNPILIIDFCKITILSLSKDFVPEPHPP